MRALKRTRVSLHILTEMWLYVFAADVQHEREQVVFTSGESIDSSAALKHILLFYMSEGGIVLFFTALHLLQFPPVMQIKILRGKHLTA